tara:strand:- start:3130 stop:3375 length:246 start_codon:yes stop_codon:yes gene_type:complete
MKKNIFKFIIIGIIIIPFVLFATSAPNEDNDNGRYQITTSIGSKALYQTILDTKTGEYRVEMLFPDEDRKGTFMKRDAIIK